MVSFLPLSSLIIPKYENIGKNDWDGDRTELDTYNLTTPTPHPKTTKSCYVENYAYYLQVEGTLFHGMTHSLKQYPWLLNVVNQLFKSQIRADPVIEYL